MSVIETNCVNGLADDVDEYTADHPGRPPFPAPNGKLVRLPVAPAFRSFRIEIERSAVIESWAGLYPSTPDQHPIVDRTEGGMVVVGGFAGLGLMHAPAAGLLAAELILEGSISSLDPNELSLARFSKRIESVEQTGF